MSTFDAKELAAYQAWANSHGKAVPEHLWRLRLSILGSMLVAFLLEMVARQLRASGTENDLLAKSLGFIAIVLLCTSALYIIFLLDRRFMLKAMASLATFALLLSQLFGILPELPALTSKLPTLTALNAQIEGPLLLLGIILLMTSYFLALLETVSVKSLLRRHQFELYHQITERERVQEELTASRDQLRQLTAHVESVREDERARIARELHDEFGQALTSLKIDLDTLNRLIAASPDIGAKSSEVIKSMKSQLDMTMQTTRRLMSELHPPILDELGLEAAMEWLASDFTKRTGIPCKLNASAEHAVINREKATALFRIAQECLTNIMRHASAKQAEVNYSAENGHIKLEVADDGCGIDKKNGNGAGKKFGIVGMRERATLLGGSFNIQSGAGQGTRVGVSIPNR
jgi:signal transduction histidine kinase